MDGVIDRAKISVGAYISTRTPLAVVVQTNPAHVRFPLGLPHRSRRYRLPLHA